MLSKDAAERSAQTVLDPRSTIETASNGSGPVNDPPGTDNKPPGFAGLDPLDLLA